ELAVPTNTSSVRLKLSADVGESLLIVQRDIVPNVGASGNTPSSGGAKISKAGDETYFILPTSGTNVAAGTYYIGVVSEGVGPTSTRIGTNSSSATLTSLGALPVQDIGLLGGSDIVHADTIPATEMKAYQFTLPSNLLGVE